MRERGRSRGVGQSRGRGRFRSGAGGSTSVRGGHTLARGAQMCAGLGASSRPPAGSLAPATKRKDGDLRVRSAPPARVGAERGPHPAPTEAAGAGRPGLRNVRPGPSTVPAAQAPPRPSESRVSAGPGGRGGDPGQRGSGVPGLPLCRSQGALSRAGGRRSAARPPGEAQRRWRPLRRGGRAEREPLPGPRAVRSSLRAAGARGGGRSQLGPRLDSFTDTTPGRPAPRRDTPAPRRLPPPAGPRASPPLGVTHPGAHTPSRRPSLPLAHTALLTPLSGFVSAHTHVLTRIPSLHTPSLAPFPPHFLEESPYSFRSLLACPTPTFSPFLKPPPLLKCSCY